MTYVALRIAVATTAVEGKEEEQERVMRKTRA